ncbi:aminotransferase class I/II-fold pyridoxal phosphate-dependent enzyme [Stutzerimonas nitrititolerans]|uniref:aminotransferase class I/II-fold pyridoxal phosphate-dependent enzyme n=1 Tax=Stutzerimonas nitrititolerans TaxID=2482751 RepID=UPI0028A7D652|nr:aminotransferase class I/II-fold pyridoxal phosphate-dependent enzyme [Stutzerimonas nitrititolerans]
MINLQRIIVRSGLSLRELLARMDDGSAEILLLVDDEGRLERTITDGDLRRLLLAGEGLDETVLDLPKKAPITAQKGTARSSILELMKSHGINHIPLVDDEGRPIQLLQVRDFESPILLSTPHMGDQELTFINQAFDTNWIAPLGPNVDSFERELAEKVKIGHAAALSSGTAAIHLALLMLGVGAGDRVFCSSLTFVASANPILYQGAEPVFIDSEPNSWNMSPQALGQAFAAAAREGRLPKAVIVVNLYGQSADMDPILELCDTYGVPLVEDAAESLGATYKGRASGTFGKIGIYSFNGNKIITTSGGGMLVSEDGALIEKARFYATQARDTAPWYQHSCIGFNYRMSNVLAGIGRGQLQVLEERVNQRRAVFERYLTSNMAASGFEWMPEASFGRSTRWLTSGVFVADSGVDVQQFIGRMADHRIEARRVWKPLHLQPLFDGCQYFPHADDYSVSDALFERGICLPSGSNMSEQEQERVIDVFGLLINELQK